MQRDIVKRVVGDLALNRCSNHSRQHHLIIALGEDNRDVGSTNSIVDRGVFKLKDDNRRRIHLIIKPDFKRVTIGNCRAIARHADSETREHFVQKTSAQMNLAVTNIQRSHSRKRTVIDLALNRSNNRGGQRGLIVRHHEVDLDSAWSSYETIRIIHVLELEDRFLRPIRRIIEANLELLAVGNLSSR